MPGKPGWLKVKAVTGDTAQQVQKVLMELGLHTVCEEAACPNRGECFARSTATVILLGKTCTRDCTFCAVSKGHPAQPDPDEPHRTALAVSRLGLRYVVLTSVTRDDLSDGGAGHFAQTVREIKALCLPAPLVETLIPDFKGDHDALQAVIDSSPDVISHNIETVPRLYGEVRPKASYTQSLTLLRCIHESGASIAVKSGIMVGLGETYDEIIQTMKDLAENGCAVLTIGQYLAPSRLHHPVVEYIHPDTFAQLKQDGENLGIRHVVSGPLVRSSYMADEAYNEYCE